MPRMESVPSAGLSPYFTLAGVAVERMAVAGGLPRRSGEAQANWPSGRQLPLPEGLGFSTAAGIGRRGDTRHALWHSHAIKDERHLKHQQRKATLRVHAGRSFERCYWSRAIGKRWRSGLTLYHRRRANLEAAGLMRVANLGAVDFTV